MYKTNAYAAVTANSPLAGTTIPRRDPTVKVNEAYERLLRADVKYRFPRIPEGEHQK